MSICMLLAWPNNAIHAVARFHFPGMTVTDLSVPPQTNWPRRRIVNWLLGAACALGLALVLRYTVIQPHDMGLACGEVPMPWWCPLREALVQVHLHNGWGWAALAAGVAAFFLRWTIALKIALGASLMALVLYNADFGAVALVLSLLRLARS